MKNWVRMGMVAGAVLAVGAQFVGPAKTNPSADPAQSVFARLETPSAVKATLERACNDCHSNNTRWPWYTSVAPVSWWTIDHVNQGRSHLNFSAWGQLRPQDAASLLGEICEEVESAGMPLPSYLRMHSEARLSLEDRKGVCLWAVAQRNKLTGNAGHEEHR